MARPSIENLRAIEDVATNYNWNLTFTKVPLGVTIPNNLNLVCETSTIPTAANTLMEIDIRGHKIKQPGPTTYPNTLDLEFIETVDYDIIKLTDAWLQAQSATITGIQASRNDASANIALELLNRQNEPVLVYNIIGCFIESATSGELAAEGAEALKPTMSISYDYYTLG